MPEKSTATAVMLAVALVASLVVVGVPLQETSHSTSQDTSYLRVVHASPDAPAVDVTVENRTVLENVSFGTVSDYLTLAPGTYNVTITAADDPAVEVFDGNVTLQARTATTLAASGEVSEDADTSFEPVAFRDDALAPGENHSAISVVHLSPDAPAVDVTAVTDNGTAVLADNVTFRNASDYVTVPAGNYTVDVRVATAGNNGTVVATLDLSLEGGTVYSAMAVGYVDADAAPADTPFDVLLTEDARTTITLPSEGTAPNGTATGTPNETATGTSTETETETGA